MTDYIYIFDCVYMYTHERINKFLFTVHPLKHVLVQKYIYMYIPMTKRLLSCCKIFFFVDYFVEL